jgi:RND family efflux transporter MFP subunit
MDTNRPPAPELNSRSSSRRTKLWIFAAFLTGLLVIGVYFTIDFAEQPATPDAQIKQEKSGDSAVQALQDIRGVQVLKPKQRDIAYTVRLPATLSPIAQVTLYAKVSGYLTSILVDKGDSVAAGQVLAVIDAPELAERSQQAHSTFMIKKLTYERLRNVWKENPDVIAKQDVDVAEAAYLGAKHAMGQLDTELQYTKVRAPFPGVITARFVDSGALIQAATSSTTQTMPLFTLMDMSTLRVYANVPQEEVPYAKPGVRASIKISEFPDEEFQGQITRTTGALDPTTRTMLVEIHVPNKERRLQPGMFATATLYLKEHKNALAIPPSALISGNGGQEYSVFVIEHGKAKRVPITTGLDDGVWVEVTNGLTGDEDVVLVGKAGLANGQSVQASPYTLPEGKAARQKL